MLTLRGNNSAKSRKVIEIFPKLYVSGSERCVVCYKILELKGNILFEIKNILMIVSHGKNCLKFIHYSSSNVFIYQLIVLS
jgi:hypothetical protein